MDERDGFLRAIHDEPDDDVHRLVFADWLEDHDEPEWSALIRHQCGLARLVKQGTDPFRESGSLEVSSLKPTLRDSISKSLAPLSEHLTANSRGEPDRTERNPYILFVHRGIPEHLRLVENVALQGLLATLEASRGNWARSVRFLSFGRPVPSFGYQRPSPSFSMLGRLFRSRYLSNFSDIDLRNYRISNHNRNFFPTHWPKTTRLSAASPCSTSRREPAAMSRRGTSPRSSRRNRR